MTLLRTLAATATLATGIAASDLPVRQRSVTVCMNPGANAPAVYRAQSAASQMMFAGAGVQLIWQGDLRRCAVPTTGIVIRLEGATPSDHYPRAMAYAMPYERTTIVVFYDRVQAANVPPLLPHVLVHEITHVIQGVAVHSTSDMMKARWERRDYIDMRRRPLQFTEEDVFLIHRGLDARDGLK